MDYELLAIFEICLHHNNRILNFLFVLFLCICYYKHRMPIQKMYWNVQMLPFRRNMNFLKQRSKLNASNRLWMIVNNVLVHWNNISIHPSIPFNFIRDQYTFRFAIHGFICTYYLSQENKNVDTFRLIITIKLWLFTLIRIFCFHRLYNVFCRIFYWIYWI